ncbi:MAG: hypothetical protein AAF264_02935 [Pseudomonadota bacterium]
MYDQDLYQWRINIELESHKTSDVVNLLGATSILPPARQKMMMERGRRLSLFDQDADGFWDTVSLVGAARPIRYNVISD